MKIYNTTDKEFKAYGKILDINCEEIIKTAEKIPFPESGSCYKASVDDFEKLAIKQVFQNEVYGELPVEIGYCYGHSNYLNALEWHKSSEINIAVSDFVLILGKIDEIENGKYDSKNCKAFKVKKGQCIEVYSTTLHFCPCETSSDGFGCIVILPLGTNTDLENKPNDKLIFRKNKWLISHVDNEALIARGAVPALCGENYKIEY